MKKIIGVLGVAAFAMAMFMNTSLINKSNNNQSFNLASLMVEANAQSESEGGCNYASVTFNEGTSEEIGQCSNGYTIVHRVEYGRTDCKFPGQGTLCCDRSNDYYRSLTVGECN